MTKEELKLLLPPVALSAVREGMSKAMGESYESRVRPYIPEGYENSTSEELYNHLKAISDQKEASLASGG